MNSQKCRYGLFGGLGLTLLSFFLPFMDWAEYIHAIDGSELSDQYGYSIIQLVTGLIPSGIKSMYGDNIGREKILFIIPLVLVLIGILLCFLYRTRITYMIVALASIVQIGIGYRQYDEASYNLERLSYGGMNVSFTTIAGIGFWLFILGNIVACMFAVLSFVLAQNGKSTPVIQEAVNVINNIPKAVEALGVGSTGSVLGTCGIYSGSKLELKMNEQIMIGRDSNECNLIIVAPKVSRKHCLVQYLGSAGYKVTDFSSNGTFMSNGVRLPKNHPTIVPAGTIIQLGNQENMFQLG